MRRVFWVLWIRGLFFVGALLGQTLASNPVRAQAEMEITVLEDGTHRSLAGISVTLSNSGTGFSATAVSDELGKVRFTGLTTAGAYVITAAESATTRGVTSDTLQLRSTFSRSATLVVPAKASSIEEITVMGRRAITQINSLNAEVSSTLSSNELSTLPIEARDITRTLYRLPNVTQATGFFPEAPNVSINGANSLFTNYMIDGLDNNENFLGGQKFPVPVGFAQNVTVLANNYSVEFGRTANGVVNITSKSGTNTFGGEVFFLNRPGDFLSGKSKYNTTDLSGNPVRDNFTRYQGGFSVGGPIIVDKTFFYADLSYTRDNKENRLVVPDLGLDQAVPGTNESWLGSLRLDQRWSDDWSSTLRVNVGRVFIGRQAGGLAGGVTFPSAADSQDRLSTLAALSTTYTGERLTYEGSFQYGSFRWNYGDNENGPGPQAVVLNPSGQTIAVLGNNGYVFDDFERTFQTKHKAAFDIGLHSIKVGVDFIAADFSLLGGGNVNGNYTVMLNDGQLAALKSSGRGIGLRPDDLPGNVQVTNYGVELQPKAFGRTQYLPGIYIEDRFAVTSRLNVTAGVRWDYDSLTTGGASSGDTNNFAPRASANYRLTDRMVLRGGVGLFYDKIPYTVVSDALQQNSTAAGFKTQIQQLVAKGILPASTNIDRVTFDGNLTVNPACTTYLACPTPSLAANLRNTAVANERRILNPNGYKDPSSIQATLGYQWQVTETTLFYTDAIYASGRNQLRLIDLNAPAPFVFNTAAYGSLTSAQIAAMTPAQRESAGLVRSVTTANGTRPVALLPGGARSIIVTDSGGHSRYEALNLTLVKEKGPDKFGYRVSYTLSRLMNDTDDLNFRAQDGNAFGAEWGPSLNDRTHVISAIAYFFPMDDLSLSIGALLQSGQPINYVPDARIFGTTDINGEGQSFSEGYVGNAYRSPGTNRNSGRLPWSKTFDVGARYRLPVPGGQFEIALDVFNIFNAANTSGYSVNLTQSNQIQLGSGSGFTQRSASPPRTLQVTGRYVF